MRSPAGIENIEELRRHNGIDDVELRDAVRGLHVGDAVNLTFLGGTGAFGGETLLVRITGIHGRLLKGRLAAKPASVALSGLHVGSSVAFTRGQVHSLPRDSSTETPAIARRSAARSKTPRSAGDAIG